MASASTPAKPDAPPAADDGARRRRRAPRPERTSAMLLRLSEELEGAQVSIAELLAAARGASVGAALLLFSAPLAAPLPPGAPAAFAVLLLWCAAGLAAREPRVWLPGALARRRLPGPWLRRALAGAAPWIARIERVSHARLAALGARPARILLAVLIALLAVVVLAPIPLIGNMAPGAALTVIALGVLQRDGLMIIAGAVLGLLAAALCVAIAASVIIGVGRLG
ncbi:MAG: exopolysaccharide biosynthesis protein [Pseudomonadota bacterium]